MAVLLWHGDGDNDAVDLGSILHVFPAFAEISEAVGDSAGYEELESVPGFAEQRVTPWWLSQVGAQAKKFLREHGRDVSDQTLRVLTHLASDIEGLSLGKQSAG